MDEMIEDCAPRMAEVMGWTTDEAASLLGTMLLTLRRWRAWPMLRRVVTARSCG